MELQGWGSFLVHVYPAHMYKQGLCDWFRIPINLFNYRNRELIFPKHVAVSPK